MINFFKLLTYNECHTFYFVTHHDPTGKENWIQSIAIAPGKINMYAMDYRDRFHFDLVRKLKLKYAYKDYNFMTIFYSTSQITAWYWRLKWLLYTLWSICLVETYIKLEDMNLISHPVEPGKKIYFSDLL